MRIQKLTIHAIRTHALPELCELVRDAVSGALRWAGLPYPMCLKHPPNWRGVADQVKSAAVVLLVTQTPSQVIGTVQLHLSLRPNGVHRAEVARLLVHSSVRRRGIGAALMAAIEEALQHKVNLLVLDTRTGDPSQQLYEKIGYTFAGIIPNYARGTTGALEPTSIMYKEIKDAVRYIT